MSTPRTDELYGKHHPDCYASKDYSQLYVELRAHAKLLELETNVYRAALKIAADRFRTMRHTTAAEEIEAILKETQS